MSHASADSEVSIGKDEITCAVWVLAGGQSAPRGPDRGFACWHAARRAGPLRCRSGTPPPPLWTADCRLGTPKPVPERQNAFRDASCPRTGFGHSGTPGGRPGHASTHSGPPCVPARPKPVPERPKAIPERQKPFRNASRPETPKSRSGTPAVPKRPKAVPKRRAF